MRGDVERTEDLFSMDWPALEECTQRWREEPERSEDRLTERHVGARTPGPQLLGVE